MNRSNGKRSFTVHPLAILAWSGRGYAPLTDTEALLTIGWIFRELVTWKPRTKANVYDMMRGGSGIGHGGIPAVSLDEAVEHLRELIARLVDPTHFREFRRFARARLGFRGVQRALTVPARKPPVEVFGWISHLHGVRLKKSPNRFHEGAVWLHGGKLRIDKAGRWTLSVGYSYRHDDGWGIGLEQRAGEKLEDFDERAWAWICDLIEWRNPEEWYHRFMGGADGMKRAELKSCSCVEAKMCAIKSDLRGIFRWGVGAPGFWENEIAERMVHDAHSQYRALRLIEMTGRRLRTLKKWQKEDAAKGGEA